MKRALLVALLALATCSGCTSATYTQRSDALDLRLPLRVAVLPFRDVAEGDWGLAGPAAAIVDVNPLLTDEALEKEHAPQILRGKLVANLHRTDLEILSPLVVDHWLASDELSPLRDRGAYARRMGEVLGADLVVFGTVTHWDRHYVVLASWVTVGLQVELRDGRTGESLYWGQFSSSKSAGLHKGMLAIEPAQVLAVAMGETMHGLRNTLFASLSSEVTRTAVENVLGRHDLRPPEVRHLAGRWVGTELRVLALGTPGARALLRIPGQGALPLSESAPGVYTISVEAVRSATGGTPLELELVKQRRRTRALATVR
tara:strand:- start:1054 stop:2001 length:948 start_codon:yes stop_codon:yes gene_type:complete